MTRRARRSERGQLLPIFGLMLVALMGMSALGVDVGYLRYQQRVEQSAADSAAIAAADELNYAAAADWSTAAKNDAAANGFTDDGGVTVSVTSNNPPTSGAYSGNTGAVQVVITKKQPAFFGGGFGLPVQTINARAVAVLQNTIRNCIYVLGTSASAMTLNGSTLNAPSCGIASNGGITFNGTNVTAAYIGAAGTITVNGATFPEGQPALAVAQADPCASLAGCAYLKANPPSSGTCTPKTTYQNNNSVTIPPGRYCRQLVINNVTTVVFSAGLYEFDAGLSLNGASNVSGSGVTFYNGPGSAAIVIQGSNVNLSAPTTGNTAGVMIYQEPSNTSAFVISGSGAGLAGLLYFPTVDVTLNGSLSNWLLIVVNTITVNGGGGVNVASSAFPGASGHSTLGE